MKTFSGFCIAFPKLFLGWLLRGYRWVVSPIFMTLGVHCRFIPSCSVYASEAINIHGAWKGSVMAAGRVVRCHPFCPGGHDPVPGLSSARRNKHAG